MTNRSVGRPLIESAATTAEGPGAVDTRSPAAATAATTRAPGSEMPGVPASLISTTSWPSRTRVTTCSLWATSLCSWSACNRPPLEMPFALKSTRE